MLANQTYVWIGTLNPFLLVILGLLILFIDFLPALIAFSRGHPNRLAILLLNTLFGWTGLGWLILLVWAFSGGGYSSRADWVRNP